MKKRNLKVRMAMIIFPIMIMACSEDVMEMNNQVSKEVKQKVMLSKMPPKNKVKLPPYTK